MDPADSFFSGDRYAIFGARAAGRSHGPLLVSALRKAGKRAVVIGVGATPVKGAEAFASLQGAGPVDGVVVLPPTGTEGAAFTAEALAQCAAARVARVWVYPAQGQAPPDDALRASGIDAVVGHCPCLYVAGGGFPHNLHRWIDRTLSKRRGGSVAG